MNKLLSIQKTLFVTDFDGTLMRQDKSISPFTVKALNDLRHIVEL